MDHPLSERVDNLAKRKEEALQPGSERSVERQKSRGKMLARERIEYLLDDGSFHELDMLARHRAHGMGLEENRPYTDGVITGFSACIAHERAGLGTSAYVSLSIEQNSWREVSARLGRLPYVEHVSMLGADFDVLVLVRAPDNAALRDLVLDRIQAIPGVQTTRTWLVFDELPGPGADWS